MIIQMEIGISLEISLHLNIWVLYLPESDIALADRLLDRDLPRLTFFFDLTFKPSLLPGILPMRDLSN